MTIEDQTRASPGQASAARERLASRLRMLVLLGGSVRASDLSRRIGRPLFELPIDGGRTVISHWRRQAELLAESLGLASLPTRLVIDEGQAAGVRSEPDSIAPFEVAREAAAYRGTGGLVADIARDMDDDDLMLVGTAGQVLLEPLGPVVSELAEREGRVSLVGHADGTPSGLLLVSCGALREVSPVGFVDLKEQVLPELAPEGGVRAVLRDTPVGVPVRTLADYLDALRRFHGSGPEVDPFEDGVRSTFSIAEEGATVESGATLHDAVVLAGATVRAGAGVVRSVICPGGEVASGEIVVDRALDEGTKAPAAGRRAG